LAIMSFLAAKKQVQEKERPFFLENTLFWQQKSRFRRREDLFFWRTHFSGNKKAGTEVVKTYFFCDTFLIILFWQQKADSGEVKTFLFFWFFGDTIFWAQKSKCKYDYDLFCPS